MKPFPVTQGRVFLAAYMPAIYAEEAMAFRLGPLEFGIILVIVLIVFGVGKLPQVSEALGKGLSSLRRGKNGDKNSEEIAPDKPKLITRLDDGDTPEYSTRSESGGAGS
jgi:sec-independent protein translocase protein TatA